jgi:hypothetical protein
MLFFNFLTALLVPLAASAVQTGSKLDQPNGLNLNNTSIRSFADTALSNLTFSTRPSTPPFPKACLSPSQVLELGLERFDFV